MLKYVLSVTAAALVLAISNSVLQTPAHAAEKQTGLRDRSPTLLAEATKEDIVAVAASNNNFSTLVAALKAADLVSVLQGEGPFTVFAPTNDAFAALPPGTVKTLLKPENKALLVKVLTYHVIPAKAVSSSLSSGSVSTVEGSSVAIEVTSEGVMVNDAKVIKADVMASNGVIHAIDKVILPPDM